MSSVTEKRSFKIPPCIIDKDLIKKIGNLLQKEYNIYYKECFEETMEEMKEDDFYKKYPQQLTDENIKRNMTNIRLGYLLESKERNIESSNIQSFIDAEWPNSFEEISITLGTSEGKKRISATFYIPEWRTSQVIVSGIDGIWVNGIADQLEKIFEENKLSYHFLVNHSSIKYALALAAWASLSFAVLLPLWPSIVPHLKEGTQFSLLYLLIFLLGLIVVIWPFESLLSRLFPRFEYGKTSAKKARKWIWGILVSSGFISAIVLKLLGL